MRNLPGSAYRRWIRLFVLTLATFVGGGAVVLWPLLQQRFGSNAGASDAPPILSVAEAQKQVNFPIAVPRDIPAGGRLIGARVTQIEVKGTTVPSNEQKRKSFVLAHRRIQKGYGLAISALNGRYMVRSLQGSPAEKAGIRSDRLVRLVAINGQRVEESRGGTSDSDLSKEEILAAARRPPPFNVTVKDDLGRVRVVTIKEMGTYWYPDMPTAQPIEYHTRQAALLLEVHGKQLVLIESRFAEDENPYPEVGAPGSRPIKVNGQDVWVSGPDEAPSAVWYHNDVHFWLNNYQGAVNLQEIIHLIESLQDTQTP